MKSMKSDLEELTKQVCNYYYKERNYESIKALLADQVTWIGSGKNEICLNAEEAAGYFAEEQMVYSGAFDVLDYWCQVQEINDHTGVSMVTVMIRTPEKEKYLLEADMRFSIVWEKVNGKWKIVHIHNSVPDKDMGKSRFFNTEMARTTYEIVTDQLKRAGRIDSMTGINNMEGFVIEAEDRIKEYPDQKYAVVKFGVRDFRYINRTHGFLAGDKLLKCIAENLLKCCRKPECCGRVEKDIFSILLLYEDNDTLNARMEEIRSNLTSNEWIREMKLDVNLNAGIYIPADIRTENMKDMMDKALMAMQSIKKYVKENHFAYYNERMLNQRFNNSQILTNASAAMENGEFKLYIQPQFRIEDRSIVAGEALCRWVTDDGTMIMPNDFITLFEDYNMISRFDFYMLEVICRQMREWMDKGLKLKPISINQSRVHIEEPNYLDDFCGVVDRYGVPRKCLIFELTESAFVEQGEKIIRLAGEIHNRGFRLAIDDFGTGYASLNMLSVVSADILKIDKSLLDAVNSRSKVIFKKVIEMASSMNMEVICEGVETEEQLQYLKELDCSMGQGYLVGRPMKAEDFGNLFM